MIKRMSYPAHARAILALGVPLVGSHLAQMALHVTDTVLMGWYGVNELAAVVLGALSPRTRNAQVALYQSGDVDYIVATDAVGMGLNMDVDHVAFASTRKFDGFQYRQLTIALAQRGKIAAA